MLLHCAHTQTNTHAHTHTHTNEKDSSPLFLRTSCQMPCASTSTALPLFLRSRAATQFYCLFFFIFSTLFPPPHPLLSRAHTHTPHKKQQGGTAALRQPAMPFGAFSLHCGSLVPSLSLPSPRNNSPPPPSATVPTTRPKQGRFVFFFFSFSRVVVGFLLDSTHTCILLTIVPPPPTPPPAYTSSSSAPPLLLSMPMPEE